MLRRSPQINPEACRQDQIKREHAMMDKFSFEKFKRKECHLYVRKVDPNKKQADTKESSLCHCGENENFRYHNNGYKGSPSPSDAWAANAAIQHHRTNAFGEISFLPEGEGERKPSKYIRLADDTDPDDVVKLLRDHWKLFDPKKPSLVITVIGGAKNFKLDGKKRVIFNKGLINAAQSTNAWIITSGCNMGVMKAVGEAVAEGQTFHWDKSGVKQTLKCIGIAPWGYVENRQKLESRDKKFKNAQYFVNNVIRHGKPVSLNPNHTHFLLVDDGFRGRYQGVAEFRAQLENKISKPDSGSDGGLGIPVVLMVVEGGYDAIEDVKKSLESSIPVVLCEGTGRAADILAYAYRTVVAASQGKREKTKRLSTDQEKVLEYKLSTAFGETWKERGGPENLKRQIKKFKDLVLQCCAEESFITVYDMNKHEEELDVAILSALLKGQKDFQSNIKQLELALTWNRSDVAEEKIFNQDVNFPEGKLEEIMTKALKEDKVNFVRLAMQNGVIPKRFLTREKLEDLYFGGPKASTFRQLLTYCNVDPRSSDRLAKVAELIRLLIGKAGKGHCEAVKDDDNQNEMENGHASSKDTTSFKHPYKELFLWALLMNQQNMAKYLWQLGNEPLPSALAASWIFGTLANKLPNYESDLRKSYEKSKMEFEQLAVKVLEECHNTDPEKAVLLLKKKNMIWGGMNCLQMAADAKDRAFLSTVCCQNSLNEMWERGIQSHWVMVILALFCPPMIAALKFTTLQEIDEPDIDIQENRKIESHYLSMESTLTGDKQHEKAPFDAKEKKEKSHNMNTVNNGLRKIKIFYSAPVTKFSANLVSFTLFLVLYAYMLLFDFREKISTTEWVMLAWMLTMLVEELREMFFASSADTVQEKLKEWWQFSIFNRIDMMIFILGFIGFVLRWFPEQFQASKTVYCINCVLLFVRILRFYSASSYLGPKLLMMMKMLQELFLFLMVFLVALVAYGITTQTMMYGEREPYGLIFRDIFYYGYWQLYGQLFLDEMQGASCNGENGTLGTGAPCPNPSWLVTVFTVVYLLLANILLMNILIAIFNHVFDEIQANAFEIWKYGMYFLVVEFETKPRLAPPIVIFEHLYRAAKYIFNAVCCRSQVEEIESVEINEVLVAMERECRKQYLKKQKNSENENSQKKIRFIESRVDDVAKILEENRMLEEQRHFDLDGPPTPRHSVHESLNMLPAEARNLISEEGVPLTVNVSNLNQPIKSERTVKDSTYAVKPLINSKEFLHGGDKPYQPQIFVEEPSDDDDDGDDNDAAHAEEKKAKKQAKHHRKQFHNAVQGKNNFDGNNLETQVTQQRSWEKRIFQNSGSDIESKPHVTQTFEAFSSDVPTNAVNVTGVITTLQVLESRMLSLEDHLSRVAKRLEKMEDKAEKSLYNIESLLRTAVFYQGMEVRTSNAFENQAFNP